MRTNSDLILREIYGKTILMPVRYNEASNEPIYLNELAARIWKKVSSSENCYVLQKNICEEYELDENSAEAYAVQNFIAQLVEKKLILE